MKNRINKISRSRAIELIKESKGKFFTVTFNKKDGSERTINCNTTISKNNPTSLGRITVYSISDKGYRNVDSRTISNISINGKTYNVK